MDTSLKQIIQGMAQGDVRVVQGIVISASPVKIQLVNDEQMIITEAHTVIPKHLTDHSVLVSIGNSGPHGGHYSSDGAHSHTSVFMTIQNGLKAGERVHMLSYNKGKQYYVLDRI